MKVVLFASFILLIEILPISSLHPCEVHKTCQKCIKDINLCTWCSMDKFNSTRCKSADEMYKSNCVNDSIENPKTNKKISETKNEKVTQIKPQQYNIILRPGEQLEFDVFYKEVEDYPVDLYFLIDASQSMSIIKDAIAEASKKIYDSMTQLTKNVHLGMGSFTDKNTAPYIKRRSPTENIYSFRHHIQMTEDFNEFSRIVKKIPTQQNYDNPESGLDGLGQIMACGKKEIGWREASRKIIVYASNDRYHIAGDGKHAGIVQPFDGKCYTINGNYTKELEMDYPSISIINKLATEKGFKIIFAVIEEMRSTYETLASSIRGSKVVVFKASSGKVTFDNFQLEKVLANIYEEIRKTIRLKTNENRKYVNLSFIPDCTERRKRNSNCTITHGEEKHIKGFVKLLGNYENTSMSIDIGIEGMEEEKMKMEIKIPDCDCELNTSIIQQNSLYCSGKGTKKCGICKCNPDRIGERCECNLTSGSNGDQAGCRPPGSSNTTALCSGFGSCLCGVCSCRPGYASKYCECNQDGCHNKCSGNGDCDCGHCVCHAGWSGASCDCKTEQCSKINDKICNGRGSCYCAKCVCEALPSSWDARYEQDETCVPKSCPKCHDKQCSTLANCGICHMNKKTEHECLSTCDYHIQVNVTKDLDSFLNKEAFVCENMLTNIVGCYTRFLYQYDDVNNRINLLVQSEKNCNESYYLFGGAALVTLIIVGVLTLIAWKVITEIQDRREYAKFMKDNGADVTGPVDNPIFEPATRTFSNPAFNNEHALEQTPLERMSIKM